MCSLYSSEPSEAAGSMRGDGSPFTPLWTKVNFPMTYVPANNLSSDSDLWSLGTPVRFAGTWGKLGDLPFELPCCPRPKIADTCYPG